MSFRSLQSIIHTIEQAIRLIIYSSRKFQVVDGMYFIILIFALEMPLYHLDAPKTAMQACVQKSGFILTVLELLIL